MVFVLRCAVLVGLAGCSSEEPVTRADDAGTETCANGPLPQPIADCKPKLAALGNDAAADCVARINQFRWECQCLSPLERWTEAEDCADEQAAYDADGHGAHAGFEENICSPGGRGQNECPEWTSTRDILGSCLQEMWNEGPGEDFNKHGHYLNMSDRDYTQVACGFATDANGARWSVQNFR